METIIKNIHYLERVLDPDDIKRLEHGALQYRKFGRIHFKVFSMVHVPGGPIQDITIEVKQEKSPAENYLNDAQLHQRAKDLFMPVLPPDVRFFTNTIPYTVSVADEVTPEFIRSKMTELKIKVKDIVRDTGVDRSNVAAWMNGNREMSQPVKAMFYYYFNAKE